jgi:hypothetical protein
MIGIEPSAQSKYSGAATIVDVTDPSAGATKGDGEGREMTFGLSRHALNEVSTPKNKVSTPKNKVSTYGVPRKRG